MSDDTRSLLEPLVGEWEMTTTIGSDVLARARTTIRRLGGLLILRTEAAEELSAGWEGKSPMPTDMAVGHDDHSGALTMLYADARGVDRVYAMTFDDGVWRLEGRAGEHFFQRFEGRLAPGGDRIDARWERSEDGKRWELDFELTYSRVG